MPEFFTQIFTLCGEDEFEIFSPNWEVHWKEDKEKRFPWHENNKLKGYARQLWIRADELKSANNAMTLICHSSCLQEGLLRNYINAQIPNQSIILSNEDGKNNIIFDMNLQKASKIASKIAEKNYLQYAMFKYNLSKYIHNVSAYDIIEFGLNDRFKETENKLEHVMFNACIHHAYSGIEELQLELRASKEKPGKIKGEKNPDVVNELINRLTEKNIDINKKIMWSLNKNKRKLTEKYPFPEGGIIESFDGKEVSAKEISIIDAIYYASTLRSKVSTHKIKEESMSVTRVDVGNCQDLLRRLILESVGCWQGWEKGFFFGPPGNPGFG